LKTYAGKKANGVALNPNLGINQTHASLDWLRGISCISVFFEKVCVQSLQGKGLCGGYAQVVFDHQGSEASEFKFDVS
jgi:hypothetical protein